MDDKSLIQIAAMGGVMGLGHVLSPDHLSALADAECGRRRRGVPARGAVGPRALDRHGRRGA